MHNYRCLSLRGKTLIGDLQSAFGEPPSRGTRISSQRTGAIELNLQGKSPAIVFGHADADGHLAAEQSRANLQAKGINVRKVVVSPETNSYRFWERAFPSLDFSRIQLVVAVDIAFSFRKPDRSLEALLQAVDNYPRTQFVVIDHHPLKQPANSRSNLTLIEVDSVYDCCFGTPSDELMAVAAICDGDGQTIRSRRSFEFEKRAIGVRRAAADMGGVAGPKLMGLLRLRQWDFFEALAEEPAEFHRQARGRRTANSLTSPLLKAANAD